MQVVIDANIIIAMLIRPGKPVDLFQLEELELFAPGLLFVETENNRSLIEKKSVLSSQEITAFLQIIKERIVLVPEEEFLKHKTRAKEICPDPKDIVH